MCSAPDFGVTVHMSTYTENWTQDLFNACFAAGAHVLDQCDEFSAAIAAFSDVHSSIWMTAPELACLALGGLGPDSLLAW